MEEILAEVDKVCRAQRGQPVEQMAEALAMAFLAVKMRDPKKSRALYAVSSDVEGAKIDGRCSDASESDDCWAAAERARGADARTCN